MICAHRSCGRSWDVYLDMRSARPGGVHALRNACSAHAQSMVLCMRMAAQGVVLLFQPYAATHACRVHESSHHACGARSALRCVGRGCSALTRYACALSLSLPLSLALLRHALGSMRCTGTYGARTVCNT